MKFKELKDKTKDELQFELKEAREKLRELRFKLAINQLKDVRAVRKIRQEVAWINTLLSK